MKVKIKMPDLGTTEAKIKVLKWLVPVGQEVKRGQALLEVETDKAAMEVESFVGGTLAEVVAQPEDEIEVGDVIAVMEVQAATAGAGESAEKGKATEQKEAGGSREGSVEKPAPKRAAAKKGKGMFARRRQASGGAGPSEESKGGE